MGIESLVEAAATARSAKGTCAPPNRHWARPAAADARRPLPVLR